MKNTLISYPAVHTATAELMADLQAVVAEHNTSCAPADYLTIVTESDGEVRVESIRSFSMTVVAKHAEPALSVDFQSPLGVTTRKVLEAMEKANSCDQRYSRYNSYA